MPTRGQEVLRLVIPWLGSFTVGLLSGAYMPPAVGLTVVLVHIMSLLAVVRIKRPEPPKRRPTGPPWNLPDAIPASPKVKR